ncbi:hypothetical protein A176_000755 [Myxococcus hansupus]|uniref:Uncharacterized protein n=1 Tax=Pseudomyxococcus hansupus TaxID=1297742 RepID=A0A0H4WQG7_9BACT|nr:hypothetical protein A176_000755 [Myxococcus hansupus]
MGALAGAIAIFRKKNSKHRSAAVIGAIASGIVVFGAIGNEKSRSEAAKAASIEAARQKAEASRAHEEDVSSRSRR